MIARTKRLGRGWQFWLGSAVLLGIGFWLGHVGGTVPLAAQQSKSGVAPASATVPVVDSTKRVVAYVYGSVPITREEFGDYLISLYGEEHLRLFVNKRIIEMGCAKKGIVVTPPEIEVAIDEDCNRINVSRREFENTVLKKRYNKTIDVWRTDVMLPRLMLAKLCRDQIVVDEEDLKNMYENRYGEKARCKIILWPKDQREFAFRMYGQLRGNVTADKPEANDAAWDSVATKQPDANLAARAGEIDPIGRHSGAASLEVEKLAFNLKVGEVSPIIELPIGYLVVKRIGTVEPAKVDMEKVKATLRKEALDRKLDLEIPKLFAEMQKAAAPQIMMGSARLPDPTGSPTVQDNKK